jgi:hypothetical protein
LHETKTARIALKEQFEKKRKLDKDPDMSTADPWMRDALGLADQVLDAGEGELVGMGDFGDVEFMVCPSSYSSIITILSCGPFLNQIRLLITCPSNSPLNALPSTGH